MFKRHDAPGLSVFIGFTAAVWALPHTVALGAAAAALVGANLKVRPMLVGAFMGAASLGAMGVADHMERSARFEHTEMAPSPAPSLKP